MSENVEGALRTALKAVLIVARDAGMNPDLLCESAVELMEEEFRCCAYLVPDAIKEIELAVDALPVE